VIPLRDKWFDPMNCHPFKARPVPGFCQSRRPVGY
jgi:hypothetical protein